MQANNESLKTVLDIVFNSERAMAANFTGNGDRKKSFCVDYKGLTAEDEYELASDIYVTVWEFIGRITANPLSKYEAAYMLKIGEDIGIGSFILQRTDRYASFANLRQKIIEKNLDLWGGSLKQIADIPLIQNYFDYCLWIGRSRANGFRWGKIIS